MLCEQYYLTSPDMEITEINCKSYITTIMFLFANIFDLSVHIFLTITFAHTPSFLFHLDISYCKHQFETYTVG